MSNSVSAISFFFSSPLGRVVRDRRPHSIACLCGQSPRQGGLQGDQQIQKEALLYPVFGASCVQEYH